METIKVEVLIPVDRVVDIYRLAADWLEESSEEPEPTDHHPEVAAYWSKDDVKAARFVRNNCRPLGRRILDFIAERSADESRPARWAWYDEERGFWDFDDVPGHGERIPVVGVSEIVAEPTIAKSEQAISGALSAISRLCRKVGRPVPFDTQRGAVSPAGMFFRSGEFTLESLPEGEAVIETYYWLEPGAAEAFRQARL